MDVPCGDGRAPLALGPRAGLAQVASGKRIADSGWIDVGDWALLRRVGTTWTTETTAGQQVVPDLAASDACGGTRGPCADPVELTFEASSPGGAKSTGFVPRSARWNELADEDGFEPSIPGSRVMGSSCGIPVSGRRTSK